MSELWYERLNHHKFHKGMKGKQASLSPYQHGKGVKEMTSGDEGFANPRAYKKTKYARTGSSKQWGW